MTSLLVPKAAVDTAPRQQFLMATNVLHSTLLEDEYCVRRYQG
jgi:hypothetical protein